MDGQGLHDAPDRRLDVRAGQLVGGARGVLAHGAQVGQRLRGLLAGLRAEGGQFGLLAGARFRGGRLGGVDGVGERRHLRADGGQLALLLVQAAAAAAALGHGGLLDGDRLRLDSLLGLQALQLLGLGARVGLGAADLLVQRGQAAVCARRTRAMAEREAARRSV